MTSVAPKENDLDEVPTISPRCAQTLHISLPEIIRSTDFTLESFYNMLYQNEILPLYFKGEYYYVSSLWRKPGEGIGVLKKDEENGFTAT